MCVHGQRQGRLLGHIVSKNGISTDLDKIKIIVDLPRPKNFKELQAFVGHCEYYQSFIHMYAIISKPLYRLLVNFNWIKQ